MRIEIDTEKESIETLEHLREVLFTIIDCRKIFAIKENSK